MVEMQATGTSQMSVSETVANLHSNITATTSDDLGLVKDLLVNSPASVVVGIPISQGSVAMYRTLYGGAVSVLLVFGNLLTLCAVASTDRLRVKTYALTTSLAVSNMCVGVVVLENIIFWSVSPTICEMATYKSAIRPMERLVLYVSFLHIAAIAIDRFVAVVHPLHYENYMTTKTVCVIVTVLWLFGATVSLMPYFGFLSVLKPQSCIVTLWPTFETVTELMIYIVNSMTVAFVYARIWSTAMRHKAEQQQQQFQLQRLQMPVSTICSSSTATFKEASVASKYPTAGLSVAVLPENSVARGPEPPVDKWWQFTNTVLKHRSTRTVLVLLIMYVVLWLPYFLSRLLGSILGAQVGIQTFQTASSMLGLSSTALNVVVYCAMNRDFRCAYKRILRMRKSSVYPQSSNGVQ
jgi:7 transmembrane receptor (rhodopsin family)